MDSKDNIITCLRTLIPNASEELLVSLSNKGTVNRGKKDLEKQRDSMAITVTEEGKIIVTIDEQTKVTLAQQPADCNCTCPAAGFCRHIVTAIYFAKEYLARNGETTEPLVEKNYTQEDFPELNALTAADIQNMAGKKDYAPLVLSLRKKNDAQFTYGDMLKVTVEGQKLHLPREQTMKNAICSCKERGLCRHKVYAAAAYLLYERGIPLPLPEETQAITPEIEQYLLQVCEQITEYFSRGIAGLTDDVIKAAERHYIRAYGMGLFQMAREWQWLSAEFAAYFGKNVSFSNVRTMHLLCRIYNRAEALLCAQSGERIAMLMGKRREDSIQLEQLTLWGLGAAARLTKRQDVLLSGYFYCPDIQEYLILSTLRPAENNARAIAEYLFSTGLFWEAEHSMLRICRERITVKNCVLTDGRISGTKNTIASLHGAVTQQQLNEIALPSCAALRQQLQKHTYQYFSPATEAQEVYLLRVEQVSQPIYDKIQQCCVLKATDSEGEAVTLTLQYNDMTQKVIEKLEKKEPVTNGAYLLGKFIVQNDKLTGILLDQLTDITKPEHIYF